MTLLGPHTFHAEFDLVDHELVPRTSDGGRDLIGLRPRAAADFYQDVVDALARLVRLWVRPDLVAGGLLWRRRRQRLHNRDVATILFLTGRSVGFRLS